MVSVVVAGQGWMKMLSGEWLGPCQASGALVAHLGAEQPERELAPPLGHRLDRYPQRLRSPGIRHPLGTRQDDPGPVNPPALRQRKVCSMSNRRKNACHSRSTSCAPAAVAEDHSQTGGDCHSFGTRSLGTRRMVVG